MPVTPYLTFQGTCREAMTTYQAIFGGTLDPFMPVTAAPDFEVTAEKADWVMHTGLHLDDGGTIFASDDIMGGTPPMQGCTILVEFPTAARGREVFDALAEGAEISMPYEATFWSPGFGTLKDRFGIQWMISTSEPLET